MPLSVYTRMGIVVVVVVVQLGNYEAHYGNICMVEKAIQSSAVFHCMHRAR